MNTESVLVPQHEAVKRSKTLTSKSNLYHQNARWQEKLRTLQEMLRMCEQPDFPEAEPRKQQVLFEIGGLWRRSGQYDKASSVLQQALDVFPHAGPTQRAQILGELGVVFRHANQYERARERFREQYQLGRQAALEAEAEICRAVGNEGMSIYNIAQQKQPLDSTLLKTAIDLLDERVLRARKLRDDLLKHDPFSKYVAIARSWETIGLDHLSVCYVAAGETTKAIEIAEESQAIQQGNEPTITALSLFYYGYALWHDGQHSKALGLWNAPTGTCSSPTALCKEPTRERVIFLKLMADAGVGFDTYDEQGFSPLDYVCLSDTQDATEMAEVILNDYRRQLRIKHHGSVTAPPPGGVHEIIEQTIAIRKRQAQLRRHYRITFQEHIRPQLWTGRSNVIRDLRKTYAQLLFESESLAEMCDDFRFVSFSDFKRLNRLPSSYDGLATTASEAREASFVVFVSYRWLGLTSVPSREGPDDINNTQWQRMTLAIEAFLEENKQVDRECLDIWLDYACVDQQNHDQRRRGIDALPLLVTQCDAMISLVDETYYERAWCAVEVLLIRELVQSYGSHVWWEHILNSPQTDLIHGTLQKGGVGRDFDVSRLKLTREEEDRPKLDFLVRQSKLLGKRD
ncbi:hypothetical protein MBLNU230_g1098t1 [Neophaeotheca triangularis]